LIAAAASFWFAWLLMPGVGVTDAGEIFALVGSQRGLVAASVLVQLSSAVLYVPAMVGILSQRKLAAARGVRGAAALLLIGAMGSAADAVLHLLAFAMTAPGVDTHAMTPVMMFMQGPGLILLAPILSCFFAGGIRLSIALGRAGFAPKHTSWLHYAGLVVVLLGAALASKGLVPARVVGWLFLGCVSAAQAWVGLALYRNAGSRPESTPTKLTPERLLG
jgi:hypothetical protein